MDRSWIGKSRNSSEYLNGVAEFLKVAIANAGSNKVIRCPCKHCCNLALLSPKEVAEHLLFKGMMLSYTIWTFHGEKRVMQHTDIASSSNNMVGDDMYGMIHDAFGVPLIHEKEMEQQNEIGNKIGIDVEKFYKLLENVEKELYPGCKKYSKLSFLVKLFNIKSLYGWSDTSVTALLELLRDAFPEPNEIPETFYQTRKMIKDLGLDYEKIDACENDCMLFWHGTKTDGLHKCTGCGSNRWDMNKGKK